MSRADVSHCVVSPLAAAYVLALSRREFSNAPNAEMGHVLMARSRSFVVPPLLPPPFFFLRSLIGQVRPPEAGLRGVPAVRLHHGQPRAG